MSSEADNNVPFDWRKDPWYGGHLRAENQAKYPPEKLAAYMGKVVAWYPDGSDIWGADVSMDALWERLEAAGEDPQVFVFDYLEESII